MHPPIDRHGKQLAKLAAVYIGRRQDRFLRVLPCPSVVVVIGGDIDLRLERRGENAEQSESEDPGMTTGQSLQVVAPESVIQN